MTMMIEPGTLGGLLLISGAFALYKGSAFYSIILYFIADRRNYVQKIMKICKTFTKGIRSNNGDQSNNRNSRN